MARLLQEIDNFHTSSSRYYPDFDVEKLRAEVTEVKRIKENDRRRIYYLKTAASGYYIKISTLKRSKDRIRHFMLAHRRWAEWRNFHRLAEARICVARPVMKGELKPMWSGAFFVMTEKVAGVSLDSATPAVAEKIGRFLARLHSQGIYHADLHPRNIIVQFDNQPCLIDVQQVYFLPAIPRFGRIQNLGKLFFHFAKFADSAKWFNHFLAGYNPQQKNALSMAEAMRAAGRYRHRRYKSRTRRCKKNSTEFQIVKSRTMQGYRRRDLNWDAQNLKKALENASVIKSGRVFRFQDVCIKKHSRKLFHRDRCLTSWTMSRALEVRGVQVPAARGYFKMGDCSYFISQFVNDSARLNDYLSSLRNAAQRRDALKRLAFWVKKIHTLGIRQHDFKSSNVLVQRGEFILTDLDSVKIRAVTENHKITNLAQLNASLSNALGVKDRLRFCHYYMQKETFSRRQRRGLYRKVWQIALTKNTLKSGLDLEKLCPQSDRYFSNSDSI
jgi:tRNA A-37 threonylcarbamoyl transferase component Bud32